LPQQGSAAELRQAVPAEAASIQRLEPPKPTCEQVATERTEMK
jgi:hypothetical protein